MATAFFDDLVKLCGGASKSSNTTPPKPGRYELTQFIDTVETMQSQVEKEVEKNAFVVPTANFVDSLFSVSTDPGADAEVAKSVLERLKHNGLYDNRWCQFPDHRDATEQSFYLPFIRTVAGIGRALKGLGHQPRTHIAWPEVFDRTLTSLNPYAANVRPDIVSVLGEDPNDGPKEETEGEGKETNDKKRKAPDEQVPKLWWLRVHTPVEVKTKEDERTMSDGVLQLCRYMRLVLGEQLDRRFVLGLLLCGRKLLVWLCDRSGLIGTEDPIDIHSEPETFIRIIMAFSQLEPHRLGWDPNMLLARGEEWIAPTDPSVKPSDFGQSLYDTKWQITVHPGRVYYTTEALSIIRAASLSGSGTVVWKVQDENGEECVLKRIWRLITAPTEQDIRSVLTKDSPVCEIEFCADAMVDDAVDNTHQSIRRGLEELRAKSLEKVSKRRKIADAQAGVDDATHAEKYIHLSAEGKLENLGEERQPARRVCTYTLMKTFGKPIKFFTSVGQLLRAMRDAIQGHKDLWFSRAMHRDISPGNILIVEDGKYTGRLIDLQNGKIYEHDVETPFTDPPDDEECESLIKGLKRKLGVELSHHQAQDLLNRHGFACEIESRCLALQRRKFSDQAIIAHMLSTTSDKVASFPDVDRATAKSEERLTGTEAFMSGELLLPAPKLYEKTSENRTHNHHVIHDVESFFWVFVYLCITRDGCRGSRRPELGPSLLDPKDIPLRLFVDCLFDTKSHKTLIYTKESILNAPDHFIKSILPEVHPDLQCLSTLLEGWWRLMALSYLTYDRLTPGIIHDQVLALFDAAIKKLAEAPPHGADEKRTTTPDLATQQLPPILGRSETEPSTQTGHWDGSPRRARSSPPRRSPSPRRDGSESPTPNPNPGAAPEFPSSKKRRTDNEGDLEHRERDIDDDSAPLFD